MLNAISNLQKPIQKGRQKCLLEVRLFNHPAIKPPRMLTQCDMFTKQELQAKESKKKFAQLLSFCQKGGTELP